MNKEEIYDEQISPLMKQVIDIARENGIAMLASFAIGHEDGGPDGEDATNLTVTTHLPDGDELCDERFSKSLSVIQKRNHGPAMHITTTQADGSKTMTAII